MLAVFLLAVDPEDPTFLKKQTLVRVKPPAVATAFPFAFIKSTRFLPLSYSLPLSHGGMSEPHSA